MQMVVALAQAAELCLDGALLLFLIYLGVLSLGALLGGTQRRIGEQRRAASHHPLPRFAVLIPAHDEARTISRALASLTELDYPAARRSLIVVADNCTDETAALARAAGAQVYARFDETDRSKGHALRWLLEQLDAEGRQFDGYIIVDADSHLSPNFLQAMAGALANGAQVAQGQYRVLNAHDSWMSGLRALAFALFNHVRPAGRAYLGWSAGLKGNGMCFSPEVIQRFGWGAYSLAEDAEYHLALVRAGIHVVYVPEAIVAAEMPVSLRQARTQQARWERGRLELARQYLLPLLWGALRERDGAQLDAALELILPPLSLVGGALALAATLALTLHTSLDLWLMLLLLMTFAVHLLAGALLARLPTRAYLALLLAPVFIAWKCWVYAVALVSRGSGRWVRTERVEALATEAAVPTRRAL